MEIKGFPNQINESQRIPLENHDNQRIPARAPEFFEIERRPKDRVQPTPYRHPKTLFCSPGPSEAVLGILPGVGAPRPCARSVSECI